MRYWQSYGFVFKSPNWAMNLLLGSVCLLIPVVGQIVLIGYLFEVIDVLLRRSAMQRRAEDDALNEHVMDALPADGEAIEASYPDFNFGRFTEYLVRGVWPFLVRFLISLAVTVLSFFVLFVGMALAGIASGAADSPWPIVAAYGLFWILLVLVTFLANILSTPFYLRAGLSGDFSAAFSLAFFRDLLKRAGMEIVFAELFLYLTGIFLMTGGCLLCYVGLFPAMMLQMYAQHHLEYQIYELYLERGGAPVPRKEEQAAHPERYAVEEAPSPHIMKPRPDEHSTDVRRPQQD